MTVQRIDDNGQRSHVNLRQVVFLLQRRFQCETFNGWRKLSVNVVAVAARVTSIPADVGEQHGRHPMQAVWRTSSIKAELLRAKPRQNLIRPQQGTQQVALGVAISGSVPQYIWCPACDRIQLKV